MGSFVFSQGIVSAIPIIKSPDQLSSPLKPKVVRMLWRSLPIWLLGFLRLIVVKLSDYPVSWPNKNFAQKIHGRKLQEHESEYGTHWNFFFTMGTLPVLEVLLHPILPFAPVSMIAIAIALCEYRYSSRSTSCRFTISSSPGSTICGGVAGVRALRP